ncbi:MAG: hypothetical protein IJ087_09885 [Eggerthellaceae bacterium]|nr:hypothetical protein [Eggerthellaceae bacterium]
MLDSDTWALRPEPHSSPETRGTRCDNCPHLSCIPQEGAGLHRWMYYCSRLHRRFTFKELYAITKRECPEGREIHRRFK